MIPKTIKIATRGSDLALWQARRIAAKIEARCGVPADLVIVETHGDRDQTTPLGTLGTVGVFTKALEESLRRGDADVAVHSMKDLPTTLDPAFTLAAVTERAAAHDLLLIRKDAYDPDFELRDGARVGTSSRRRHVLLKLNWPTLDVREIRGNVPTRLEKLRRGDYDAIVLAAAGVERLELPLDDLVVKRLGGGADGPSWVPAPAQGALAIEARAADADLVLLLRERLHDALVGTLVEAERRLLQLVEGGCSVPLGAHATRDDRAGITLRAVLGPAEAFEGRPLVRVALVRARSAEDAAQLAFRVIRSDVDADEGRAEMALKGARILGLREANDAPELVEALTRACAEVQFRSATHQRMLVHSHDLLAAFEALPPGSWALYASAKAFRLATPPEVAALPLFRSIHFGAVGPATARMIATHGVPVDLLADEAHGAGLADAFLALRLPRTTAVLLPCAKEGRPEIREALRSAGYDVRVLELYENVAREVPETADPRWDAIFVASPSSVDALPHRALPAKLVAIGETTAAALRARGFAVAAVAERPTTGAIVEALARAVSKVNVT